MIKKIATTLGIFASIAVSMAASQKDQAGGMNIAAVVGKKIITQDDVNQRVNLIVFTGGAPRDARILAKIRPQIVNALVEEQLQLQEAGKFKIQASDAEVDEAFKGIATQNNVSFEKMKGAFAQAGVLDSMRARLRANLTWGRYIGERYGPQVNVSDADIAMDAANGGNSYNISEIFIRYDNPQQKDSARQNADRLLTQIRGGTSFATAATEFSQSNSASQGGDVGWVKATQYESGVADRLQAAKKGDVLGPVEASNGYYIVRVNGVRMDDTTKAEDKEEMRAQMRQYRLGQFASKALRDARARAFVKIY